MAKKYLRNPINTKLYHISRICYLYPLNFNFNKRIKFRIIQHIRLLFLISSLLLLFVWNYRNKYLHLYIKVRASYGVLDFAINWLLTFFNVSCMVLVQRSSNQWQTLFKPLFKITKKRNSSKHDYVFWCTHLMQIVWIIAEMGIYFYYSSSVATPVFVSLIDKINVYMIQITTLLIHGYVTCIKEDVALVIDRFQSEIERLVTLRNTEKSDVDVYEKFTSVSEVDDILRFVIDIFKAIDAFNRIYGVQILGLSSLLMLFMTNTLNSLVIFITHPIIVIGILTLKSYPSITLSIFVVLTVYPCFEATKKIDQVAKVTNRLMTQLPHGLENRRCKILKEKLILLMKQLEFRKPYFSAAGFYEINYSVFMYIFGGVTSFVVVYVQLNYKI